MILKNNLFREFLIFWGWGRGRGDFFDSKNSLKRYDTITHNKSFCAILYLFKYAFFPLSGISVERQYYN